MKSMLEKRVTLEKRRLKQLPTVLHSLLGQLKRKKTSQWRSGGWKRGRDYLINMLVLKHLIENSYTSICKRKKQKKDWHRNMQPQRRSSQRQPKYSLGLRPAQTEQNHIAIRNLPKWFLIMRSGTRNEANRISVHLRDLHIQENGEIFRIHRHRKIQDTKTM
ncbi:unknown [Clostridium sp. CAG:43]|nr:unknown [Clostridium sp. CAG:43]